MPKFIYFLLFFTSLSFGQTRIVTGQISDTLNLPVENANIIAKPLQDNKQLKFSITDQKGNYKLELEATVKYELLVSYIGFSDQTMVLEPGTDLLSHNFVLQPTGEELKEIVITHEFKPIIVKKDTLIFNVGSFASGNERKMKEVLEKLPGVEVDKNGAITVQGKRVTKMLVEGNLFFGGGSKLAVENIPADALDKIEVIDNFNEVGFMKQVSDSEDLAMNVKLKENKKKFVFGDIEAGVGSDKYYMAHAALFYYSPKTNLGFIGDANTIGQRTFSFDDLMRFNGGVSNYITGRTQLSNLYGFIDDNKDVIKNKTQFAALNFSQQASDKLTISGFGLFSKLFTGALVESEINYLQTESDISEKRNLTSNNQSVMAIGNVKLDYNRRKNEKWYYNAQYQFSNNDFKSTLKSVINEKANIFQTLRYADNSSVKQYIEWHKSYNSSNTTTFAVNHVYEKNTPKNTWITNTQFLPGLIPLQEDINYNVQQVKSFKSNSIDVLFKHYWIINNFNHIYSVIGNNNNNSTLITEEQQQLSNGTINNFTDSGLFGNDLHYNFNDAFAGIEYKFKIGKLITRPGVYYHWYSLKTNQPDGSNNTSKLLFEPQLNSEYEFSSSENLNFNYRLTNAFANPDQLAGRFTLQSYNSVYRGNAMLGNIRYHSAFLRYRKTSMSKGMNINGSISFNKKVKTIRNIVQVDDVVNNGTVLINQFTTPVLTNNPETTWHTQTSVQKKIWNFSLKLSTGLSWFTYIQTLNGIAATNRQNAQDAGILVKTANKKWPSVSAGYTKTWSHFKGFGNYKYENDTFEGNFDYEFITNWTIMGNYTYFNNQDSQTQANYYQLGNISLGYKVKNSAWSFEARVNNVLNNKEKSATSFSDFSVATQTIYILPRIALFTVRYKL